MPTSVIVQNPRGLELVVSITGSTCHLSEADARAVTGTVTMPTTITAEEEFFLPDGATLTISVEHNGYEIVGTPDGTPMTVQLATGMTHYIQPSYDDASSVARGTSLLPEYGPVFNKWDGTVSEGAGFADNSAVLAAWLDELPVRTDTTYPGEHPDTGAWSELWDTYRAWGATDPGLYSIYVYQGANIENELSGTRVAFGVPTERVAASVHTPDTAVVGYSSGFQATLRLVMPISQGMIDAGVGGFVIAAPQLYAAGSEQILDALCYVIIQRYSPGSAFDYFGDI